MASFPAPVSFFSTMTLGRPKMGPLWPQGLVQEWAGVQAGVCECRERGRLSCSSRDAVRCELLLAVVSPHPEKSACSRRRTRPAPGRNREERRMMSDEVHAPGAMCSPGWVCFLRLGFMSPFC